MTYTSSVSPTTFEERLLPVLIQALEENTAHAPRRSTRGARQRRLLAVIAAAVAALAIAGSVLTSVAADRTIEVKAGEALRHPEQVERELKETGIDADVRTVPVEPALEGKWFHLYFEPGVDVDPAVFAVLQAQVGVIDMAVREVAERCPLGDCERTRTLELPVSVRGPLTLVAGRPARSGEEYWARNIDWGNELAPSGALYCYRLEARTPLEAGQILKRLGYEVRWVYETAKRSDPVGAPPPGSEITAAWFPEPGVVDVRLASRENAEPWRKSAGTPSKSHPRPSVPWAPSC